MDTFYIATPAIVLFGTLCWFSWTSSIIRHCLLFDLVACTFRLPINSIIIRLGPVVSVTCFQEPPMNQRLIQANCPVIAQRIQTTVPLKSY